MSKCLGAILSVVAFLVVSSSAVLAGDMEVLGVKFPGKRTQHDLPG
jgi:hypothetical protein